MAGILKNEEEFNNFMQRVTEVHSIVSKLSADDKTLNQIGIVEADRILNDNSGTKIENIDDIQLKVTSSKTVINKIKEEPENPDEMSKEAFMKGIEKDAKERYENKKIRKEKSDTLKVQANKAFRRGEYERAVCLYDKAIEFTKDSCVLYTNRALACIHLKMFDKAEKDCDLALRLNENSLKAYLYLAGIAYEKNDTEKYEENIKEALERHPNKKDEIYNFISNFKTKDEREKENE